MGDIGEAKVLTAADYNYPKTGTADSVGAWLLKPGVYVSNGGINVRFTSGIIVRNRPVLLFVGGKNDSVQDIIVDEIGGDGLGIAHITNPWTGFGTYYQILDKSSIINSLTSTLTTSPLSAAQGKVLKDLIDALDARVTALEGN